MADTNAPYYGTMIKAPLTTGGAITARRLMKIAADGDVEQAVFNDENVIGANPGTTDIPSGERLDFGNIGPVQGPGVPVVADVPINEGERLKSAAGGRVIPLMTDELAGNTIDSDATPGNFSNQPANDGVEILSDNAGDTQDATVWYTRNGEGDTVFSETVTLTGTSEVALTHTDVQLVLGVELASAPDGTVTVREASGDQTITTITGSATTAGVEDVDSAQQRLGFNATPVAVADGASTKQIGLIGTDENGDELFDSQALDGTTEVSFNDTFQTVTRVLVGDVATGTAVTFSAGAADSETLAVGRAIEAATAQDDLIYATINP